MTPDCGARIRLKALWFVCVCGKVTWVERGIIPVSLACFLDSVVKWISQVQLSRRITYDAMHRKLSRHWKSHAGPYNEQG